MTRTWRHTRLKLPLIKPLLKAFIELWGLPTRVATQLKEKVKKQTEMLTKPTTQNGIVCFLKNRK